MYGSAWCSLEPIRKPVAYTAPAWSAATEDRLRATVRSHVIEGAAATEICWSWIRSKATVLAAMASGVLRG
jgi:hypothetical protein